MKKEKQGRTIDSHLKKVMKCVRERGSIGCVKGHIRVRAGEVVKR